MNLSQAAQKQMEKAASEFAATLAGIIGDDVRSQFLQRVKESIDATAGLRSSRTASAPLATRGKATRRSKEVNIGKALPKLVELVRANKGTVQPNAARKALGLSPFQIRKVVAEGVKQRVLRTEGVRRSTVYRLGPKITKKAA